MSFSCATNCDEVQQRISFHEASVDRGMKQNVAQDSAGIATMTVQSKPVKEITEKRSSTSSGSQNFPHTTSTFVPQLNIITYLIVI